MVEKDTWLSDFSLNLFSPGAFIYTCPKASCGRTRDTIAKDSPLSQSTYSLFCIWGSSPTDWSISIIGLVCNVYHSVGKHKSPERRAIRTCLQLFKSCRSKWTQEQGPRVLCPRHEKQASTVCSTQRKSVCSTQRWQWWLRMRVSQDVIFMAAWRKRINKVLKNK